MSQARTRWVGAIILVVAACGDDQAGTHEDAGGDPPLDAPDDTGPDLVAPEIAMVAPSEGAPSAWVHDRFTVTFTEAISPSTIDTTALRLLDGSDRDLTASVVLSGDRTAEVRAREDAALFGTLRLEVANTITDLAGNALTAPATFTWQLAPWAKRPGGLDVGMDPDSPVIAVTTDGAVVATASGAAAARTVRVVDDQGRTLGDPLGAGSATSPSIAPLAGGGAVVAWVEAATGAIEVARWDGSAWTPLPSPGTGARPAVASSPDGGFGLVWVGDGGVVARRMDGTAWSAAGGPVVITRVVSELAAAMPDDTTLVAAFVDRTASADQVRTLRFTGVAAEAPRITQLAPGPSPHVSLAAREGRLAIAWDEWSGHSLGVFAAQSTGGAWTVLPMLDVDPPANARAPSIALDGADAPVVAWTEQLDGVQRGFVARWNGSAWRAVGGDAWTDAASQAPVRTALGLWHGREPVVAWREESAQTIELARFNGPAAARLGLTSRASLAGCAFDLANPPATLSATGCFTIAAGEAKPHAGLVPYDLRAELWSDGAHKRRWLALPSGQGLTELANGSLDAPAGSLVIKEFAVGDPAAPVIVETRFLVRTASGWQGRTYQWRANGTDADLLAGEGATRVTWSLPGGGTHDHVYPSRAECLRCHNATVGPLLGVRRNQLARAFDYGGILDDQPRTLAQLGILTPAVVDPLPAPHDPRLSDERRLRGYLAANCAHCHNPNGECYGQDFRITTPLAQTSLCNLVVPGNPEASRIYQMITSRPGMPPLGTLETDPLIIDVARRWITGMTSCP